MKRKKYGVIWTSLFFLSAVTACVCACDGAQSQNSNPADEMQSGGAFICTDHDFSAQDTSRANLASEATCSSPATYYYTCSMCGEKGNTVFQYGEKLQHDCMAYPQQDPTCTSEGWYAYESCNNCTYSTKQTIPMIDHDYTTVVTDPTCTEQGYTTYTCACNYSYVGDYTDATGHDYTTVVIDPTCTEQGYTTYTCACSDSYVDDYKNATGHDYTTVVTDPTCTEKGYTTYTCACSYSYVDDYKNATGHSYTTVVTDPTCTEKGYTTYTCACSDSYQADYVDATGHSYTAVVANPTCEKQGYTTYTCACSDSYKADFVDAKGHSYEVKQVVAPTCLGQGYTYWVCTNKGCFSSNATDWTAPTGHIYETVTIQPTCTEQGQATHTCKCGDSYSEILDATGHSHVAHVTQPTCTEQGYTTHLCKCNDVYITDYVEATGHTYTAETTAPTCTEQGYTTYTCDCGDHYTADYIAAGHSYKDGKCQNCDRVQGYKREGNTVYFGSYPQSRVVENELIQQLNTLAGTVPAPGHNYAWISFEYYASGSNVSDYMWYQDVLYGEDTYRGVYFSSYRPNTTTGAGNTNNSNQDENGYVTNSVYWFKYEPIRWTIIRQGDGKALLVADFILDSQQFDYGSLPGENNDLNAQSSTPNNYMYSTIRHWLNSTFMSDAFRFVESDIIVTTTVKNGAETTGYNENKYACGDTQDKIFLLSYDEANTYLGTSGAKASSDYAKCQGVYVNQTSGYEGNGVWWLRSPSSSQYDFAQCIYYNGIAGDHNVAAANATHLGVVPALWIEL